MWPGAERNEFELAIDEHKSHFAKCQVATRDDWKKSFPRDGRPRGTNSCEGRGSIGLSGVDGYSRSTIAYLSPTQPLPQSRVHSKSNGEMQGLCIERPIDDHNCRVMAWYEVNMEQRQSRQVVRREDEWTM